MAGLTPKQQLFCEEYLVDLNATQAAIRAGYSEKTAEQMGYQLLQKTSVKAYLSTRGKARQERTEIDQDYVLRRLAEIDQMDVADIMNDDGSLLPIKQWPKVWRQSLNGIEVSEMFDGSGDQKVLAGLLKKIKFPETLKNLELIGKHVTVGAFSEKIDHNHSFTGPDGKPLTIILETVYVSPTGEKRNG